MKKRKFTCLLSATLTAAMLISMVPSGRGKRLYQI